MRSYLLAAVILSSFPAAALAATSGQQLAGDQSTSTARAMPSFQSVDRDNDGRISQDEAATVKGLAVKEADTDGDGTLSPEEYAAAIEKMQKS